MDKFHNILIVDSNPHDQQLIALLFKRSLSRIFNSSLSLTYAASVAEAKNLLSKNLFSIITLDGEFPSYIDHVLGQNIIPFIREFHSPIPIIMMISNERLFVKRGLQNGVDFGFYKQDINGQVKLNEKFELIPLEHSLIITR
ncbi:MAG: response regulator [bacterium]